ncbi:MAG: hypothetical protein ACJ8CR_27825 [Roseiflexaceae bacterium]
MKGRKGEGVKGMSTILYPRFSGSFVLCPLFFVLEQVITMFRPFMSSMVMHMRGRPRYGVPMLSAD